MPRRPPLRTLRTPKGVRLGGRAKGTPNAATANAREAIARFVDGNCERLQEWLKAIAKEHGPKAAFACVVDLLEFTSRSSPAPN